MSGTQLSASHEYRFRWYNQVEKYGRSVKDVCQIFGISRKTYYKWYSLDHGLSSKVYHSRKTHPQTKIFGRVRVLLVEAKIKYNYGPKKMREYLLRETGVSLAPSTIYKFYNKRNLIMKRRKKQKWYTPLKQPYVAKVPGENVQLDVKYIPGFDGRWHYQYRFIDTVTSMQYCLETTEKTARKTIKAFQGAVRSFPFPIVGIQTDNGGEFRGVFHEYLIKSNITHRYIPKRSAPWNGKVERANRSVDDEFFLNKNRPWTSIKQYTNWYNTERPHLGKGMNGLTPEQKYLTFVASKCHP